MYNSATYRINPSLKSPAFSIEELKRLFKLRDEEHRKDILKRLATSKPIYEEIIELLEGEPEKPIES